MVYWAPLGLRAPRIDEQMKIDGSEDSRKDVDLDQPTPPFVLFASGRLLPCFKGLWGFDFFQNRVCDFQLSEIVNKWQPTSSSGCLLHLLPGTVLPWFSEKVNYYVPIRAWFRNAVGRYNTCATAVTLC